MNNPSSPAPQSTSKRVKYATDNWGGIANCAHLEIEWRGHTLMVEITDDKIEIIGTCGFKVDNIKLNSVSLTANSPAFPQTSGNGIAFGRDKFRMLQHREIASALKNGAPTPT